MGILILAALIGAIILLILGVSRKRGEFIAIGIALLLFVVGFFIFLGMLLDSM